MKGPHAEDSGDTETTRYEFSSLTIDLRRPKYVRDADKENALTENKWD